MQNQQINSQEAWCNNMVANAIKVLLVVLQVLDLMRSYFYKSTPVPDNIFHTYFRGKKSIPL